MKQANSDLCLFILDSARGKEQSAYNNKHTGIVDLVGMGANSSCRVCSQKLLCANLEGAEFITLLHVLPRQVGSTGWIQENS